MQSSNQESPIISLVDAKVLAIPIQENHEPMVELKQQSILSFGPSPEVPNNQDYTQLRASVYEKLCQAQALLPKGMKFCLYEGYRSLALQEKLFTDRYQSLQQHYPSWNHQQLFYETTRLISPVTNFDGSRNIPPHSTGGAIDVYLLDDNNDVIDMGMHPADWVYDLDGILSATHSTKISETATHHRAIMCRALAQVGFVNYLGEYWHWSYGDRYWAYHVAHAFAPYGTLA